MRTYKCPRCNRLYQRDSDKKRIKSYCEQRGVSTYLMLLPEQPVDIPDHIRQESNEHWSDKGSRLWFEDDPNEKREP